jgi:hypothetical protein
MFQTCGSATTGGSGLYEDSTWGQRERQEAQTLQQPVLGR